MNILKEIIIIILILKGIWWNTQVLFHSYLQRNRLSFLSIIISTSFLHLSKVNLNTYSYKSFPQYAHLPIKSTTDRRLQLHHKAFNAFAIGCIPTSPIRLTENRLEYGIWTKSQCPKHMANELIPSFDKICKNKTAKTMPSKTIQTMQIRPA